MKNLFRKGEKQKVEVKSTKTKVKRVGTRKKAVIVLWIVLISSLAFGIYKNFTAIDQHTVHEKEVIETKLMDTNAIESFTKRFVKDNYTWQNKKNSLSVLYNVLMSTLDFDIYKNFTAIDQHIVHEKEIIENK